MIKRDENGEILSADSLSDIAGELKPIYDELSFVVNADEAELAAMPEDKKLSISAKAKDLKALVSLITPELQSAAGAREKIGFVKEILKIKTLMQKLQKISDNLESTDNNDDKADL